jgi:CheY-like chemotaxis protein
VPLRGDARRLRQILLNLIGNAIKFTEQGEMSVAATVEPDLAGGWLLRCDVRDSGIGIADADQRRLFADFHQVDSAHDRRFGGTGLGLSICRKLIEAMGGRIKVASAPGAGSVFTIELTLSEEASSAPPSDHASPAATGASVPIEAKRRVLLVEDNPVNQAVVSAMLRHLNCEVRIASDGARAVTAAAEESFDIILMDLQMPVMDGYEATRRIRRLSPPARETPIVALSANVGAGDEPDSPAARMDERLSKPVTISVLADLLARRVPSAALAHAGDPG